MLLLPICEGKKSGTNLPPTGIVEKSPVYGNLTEDQLVGNSVKVSTPDFGPQMVMEWFKETIEQTLICMRETLDKELEGGRRHEKRTKDG